VGYSLNLMAIIILLGLRLDILMSAL
jgi:hypothetical protein